MIDPDGPGGKPLTLIQSWAILYYLAQKGEKTDPERSQGRRSDLSIARETASEWRRLRGSVTAWGDRVGNRLGVQRGMRLELTVAPGLDQAPRSGMKTG